MLSRETKFSSLISGPDGDRMDKIKWKERLTNPENEMQCGRGSIEEERKTERMERDGKRKRKKEKDEEESEEAEKSNTGEGECKSRYSTDGGAGENYEGCDGDGDGDGDGDDDGASDGTGGGYHSRVSSKSAQPVGQLFNELRFSSLRRGGKLRGAWSEPS
ncbi:hypothetical protein HZH68_003579 [Vespula germanica]|uniref:Uncharacterized protein n=1 Tax=Vespula germanica TaxID=30212 RepID=A0A834NPE8_VESGE|nr:hypothetical protein HZH68_003579 [Vespula germanica]